MPDYALELSFDESGDQAIRAHWSALKQAGLPSQADHTSMTNAPHLTLAAARAIPPHVVALAGEVLSLPERLTVRGVVLFGEGSRITIAHLVEPSVALAEAVGVIRAAVPEVRQPVWTPHVTVARRVPRAKVGDALSVLHESEVVRTLTAARLRWWDPVEKVVSDVSTQAPSDQSGSDQPSSEA